jgi:transposase-like protein
LHRALGITQKSAWFLAHRIRLALQNGTFEKLSGEIEADETYIGGKVRNMHADKKRKRGRGTGGVGKAIVMGLLERNSKNKASAVKLKHVQNARRSTVQGEIRQHVAAGSHVFTDALPSYKGLNSDYVHKAIDHAKEYVRGNVHTNGLENFWCLLKRGIRGTYVSVEPFHLFRYLDEQAFRFNERETTDSERFLKAIPSNHRASLDLAPNSRLVLDEQSANLPKQESYSRLDVGNAILSAVRDMAHHVPTFIYGAFIMFGGAVILDWSKRCK